MTPMFQAVLSNVRVGKEPELAYTPQGIAVLKVKLLGDKWISGKGENRQDKTISFQVTFWREKAEYLDKLLKSYIGKSGKPGVGALVTIFVNQMPDTWSRQSEAGETFTDICVTGYDMIIHSPLDREAWRGSDDAPVEETPF